MPPWHVACEVRSVPALSPTWTPFSETRANVPEDHRWILRPATDRHTPGQHTARAASGPEATAEAFGALARPGR